MIQNKFLHYKTLSGFRADLFAGKISLNSICFIADSLLIYTHGNYYYCLNTKNGIDNRIKQIDTIVSTSSTGNKYRFLDADGRTTAYIAVNESTGVISFVDSTGKTVTAPIVKSLKIKDVVSELPALPNEDYLTGDIIGVYGQDDTTIYILSSTGWQSVGNFDITNVQIDQQLSNSTTSVPSTKLLSDTKDDILGLVMPNITSLTSWIQEISQAYTGFINTVSGEMDDVRDTLSQHSTILDLMTTAKKTVVLDNEDQYEAISQKDPNTFYFIKEEES